MFDGMSVPFTEGAFATVMFVDVLHHTAEPMNLLRETVHFGRVVSRIRRTEHQFMEKSSETPPAPRRLDLRAVLTLCCLARDAGPEIVVRYDVAIGADVRLKG